MSHPPRPPVGDVLDGLVAIVEQETAAGPGRRKGRKAVGSRRHKGCCQGEEFSLAASSC
jgi:hypothetical protein